MARMHSKKRGKAKSRKPIVDSSEFGNGAGDLSKEEIGKLAASYARQGMSPAAIGEKLKKEHGIPYVKQATGVRLVNLLKDNGVSSDIPHDMLDLMTRAVRMRKHLEKNKQDVYNRIRLMRVESKLFRLSRYYVREGVLPSGWKYDPAKAELIVKRR